MAIRSQSFTVEQLVWLITWTKAFPTLCSSKEWFVHGSKNNDSYHHDDNIHNDFIESVWSLLAYQTMFEDYTLTNDSSTTNKQKWKHKRDMTTMENSLGYGEITTVAVFEIMETLMRLNVTLAAKDMKVVADLGSGNGRVLLAACLVYPFLKAIGIEILPELHQEATCHLGCWRRWEMDINNPSCSTAFEFLCDDFTNFKLRVAQADLVFVHATVFTEELMAEVQETCEQCGSGTYFAMVTKPLDIEGTSIETLVKFQLHMNWGQATVYIQKKI